VVGIVDKQNPIGDFYITGESDLTFTVTKPQMLNNIRIQITDPDGSLAPVGPKSAVIFKLTRERQLATEVAKEVYEDFLKTQTKASIKMEIKGYSDYLIYDDGRIWSKPRKDSRGHQMKGRFLKHGKTQKGYHKVCLCRDGKPKDFLVSRLVALHYIANPENKPQVDHIDRDIDNNHVSNLRWATIQENCDNRGMTIRNTSGHEGIYEKGNRWIFQYRRNGYRVQIYSKSKTEALCVKFAFLILTQS
jgi:hypothetical protein